MDKATAADEESPVTPAEKRRINILMVDDQPAKLLSYELILSELGENLLKASTGQEALNILLRHEIAVVLVDVYMPDMNGFDLTTMIRQHPRFHDTAVILVSGVHLAEIDWLRGYGSGAVDYVSVPIVPELLRAKVRVFADLYRKTRELQAMNRRLEELVEERTAELRRSNEELQQFAYVASHDLQEPLRMISSFLQLLAKRFEHGLDSEASEFVGYAVGGAQRMHELISDLLAYSRVDRGGQGFMSVDCEHALDEALENLELALRENDALVTHGSLPTVRGDDIQLVQVLTNLIGNAVKFRRKDVRPEVRIEARPSGQEWLFSIRDNGIGIDPAYFERIFQVFQRLHGRAEYPGTGIGLAICKKIIERHQGRIWVESTPGEGTVFYFALPKVDDPSPESERTRDGADFAEVEEDASDPTALAPEAPSAARATS